MIRPVEARIRLDALGQNLERVRAAAPRSRIMAIVKANGYGHGAVRVARSLSRADAFGVASLEEALTLREGGITQPIMLLSGFLEARELPLIARYDFWLTVHHAFQVDILARTRLEAPLHIWLKIDTGMHRLGVVPSAVPHIVERLRAIAWIAKPFGLMTHFACADELDSEHTRAQMACFGAAVRALAGERSLANSAGIFAWPDSHGDWVRPGIVLYGVSPFATRTAASLGLVPVMTMKSRLIAINALRRGDAIGYGGAWVCPEDMPVGIVAMGYGDGYPRHAVSGTPVLVNGHRVPLIGRVSMDSLYVDLRAHPGAAIGDSVTLWGEGLAVEDVAAAAGTIPYELLCKVTGRVKFVDC
jgi:alanine racemase